MKLIAVFLVCFTAEILSQQVMDYFPRVQSVRGDCITESSVNTDLVDRLFQVGEFNEDAKLKCFLKCILVKVNAMSPNGNIQADVWKAQFPPGLDQGAISVAVEKCKGQTGVDACDTAFKAAKCAYESMTVN